MWPLIRKDLIRRWRSPVPTLAMLIFPLFMSVALGTLIGNSGGQEFPALRVLIENRDTDGFLTEFIIGALGQEEGQERIDATMVEPGEGEALMDKGKSSALVIFPESFTADVLEHRPTQITVVRNPAEGIPPEVVAQGVGALSTYLDQAARLLGDELLTMQGFFEADEMPAAAQVGALAGAVMTKVEGVERYLFPPLVKVVSKKAESEDDGPGFSVFAYVLLMTTVMAVLFVAVRAIYDLFEEEKSGMLKRQAATPLPISKIVASKLFFGILLSTLVTAILAITGIILGWIELPVDPLAALALTIAFSAAGCGVLSVLFAFTRNEKQAGILSWLVIMGMSALGGSMIPLENFPEGMRGLSRFTLNYWAIDGFKEVLFSGANTFAILPQLTVLLAIAAVTLLLGQFLLTRRLREVRA